MARPTDALRQARALRHALGELERKLPSVLEAAVRVATSPTTAPSVAVQAFGTIDKLEPLVARALAAAEAAAPISRNERTEAAEVLRRLLRLGLVGYVSVRPEVESQFDGRSLRALAADFHAQADEAEAERDRLLAARAEIERLEAVERRPLTLAFSLDPKKASGGASTS